MPFDVGSLTATVKCNAERLFFSKKRKVGAWVLRGTIEAGGKIISPFDMAVVADGKEIALYNRAPEAGK